MRDGENSEKKFLYEHTSRLEVSYLSKWGTNVLLLLFGCARERAGDYYGMGCRIPAVEGATVELSPYVSKKLDHRPSVQACYR